MRLPTRGWIGESKVERVVRLVNWAALALILDSHDLMTEVTMMMMSSCTHSNNNDSPSIAPPDKRTSSIELGASPPFQYHMEMQWCTLLD